MIESIVKISMRDDNDLNCSYAIVHKGNTSVIIILNNLECAIFNYRQLKAENFDYHYLLLKHYSDEAQAYTDFLKLIGKMCKKYESSKYFLNPINEDNRMICTTVEDAHMILPEETLSYQERFVSYKEFICRNRQSF